jgi:hypothetical protein
MLLWKILKKKNEKQPFRFELASHLIIGDTPELQHLWYEKMLTGVNNL